MGKKTAEKGTKTDGSGICSKRLVSLEDAAQSIAAGLDSTPLAY